MSFSGLIGKNIEYSYSKEIHSLLGNNEYEIFSVDSERDFIQLVNKEFNYLNVTIPFKGEAFKAAQIKDEVAQETGVVNTLINKGNQIYGYNTDAYGFEYLLNKNKIKVRGKNCVIFGTGATSKTVAYVLSKLGSKTITFVSRNPRGNDVVSYNDYAVISQADILINTTPVTSESLIYFPYINRAQVFIDVVYNPFNSKMILEATQKGIKTVNGLRMLVAQAIKTYDLAYDVVTPDDVYEKIYRQILKSHVKVLSIGHPFSGKTEIFRKTAEKYGWNFLDLDQEISNKMNMSIEEIFKKYGEQKFRDLEKKALLSLKDNVGYFISLGGGAVLHEKELSILEPNSIIINISRPLNLIKSSQLANRPLCKSIKDLQALIEKRRKLYSRFSQINIVNKGTINEAVNKIWEAL